MPSRADRRGFTPNPLPDSANPRASPAGRCDPGDSPWDTVRRERVEGLGVPATPWRDSVPRLRSSPSRRPARHTGRRRPVASHRHEPGRSRLGVCRSRLCRTFGMLSLFRFPGLLEWGDTGRRNGFLMPKARPAEFHRWAIELAQAGGKPAPVRAGAACTDLCAGRTWGRAARGRFGVMADSESGLR
jgi:hypothetical protein